MAGQDTAGTEGTFRRRGVAVVLSSVLFLAVFGIGVLVVQALSGPALPSLGLSGESADAGGETPGQQAEAPSTTELEEVVGQPVEEVEAQLDDAGVPVVMRRDVRTDVPAGRVTAVRAGRTGVVVLVATPPSPGQNRPAPGPSGGGPAARPAAQAPTTQQPGPGPADGDGGPTVDDPGPVVVAPAEEQPVPEQPAPEQPAPPVDEQPPPVDQGEDPEPEDEEPPAGEEPAPEQPPAGDPAAPTL